MKTLQLNRPHMLILIGVPGSGRTTFAKRFSDLFQAPYIDIKSFAPTAVSNDALTEIGSMIVKQLTKTNQTIVYEGISGSRAERQAIAKIARDAGYTPLLVWFQVSQAAAQQRADRNRRRADPLLEEVYQNYKFTEPNERESYVVVSGLHTYPSQARTILRRLAEITGRANHGPISVSQRHDKTTSTRSIRVQ